MVRLNGSLRAMVILVEMLSLMNDRWGFGGCLGFSLTGQRLSGQEVWILVSTFCYDVSSDVTAY